MNAAEFFEAVRDAAKRACELRETLRDEERYASSPVSGISDARSSVLGDPTPRAAERVATLQTRCEAQDASAAHLERMADSVLCELPSPSLERLMRLHYLQGKCMDSAANIMHISPRTAYSLRKKAFEWIDESGLLAEFDG